MARDGDPAAALRAARLRATPQRRAILAAFAGGAAEHLSAEEIHARASGRIEGLGRGTVYATLADLAEAGLLASVGDQDPVRYEVNTDRHDHFRCRLCLRLFDVELRGVSGRALTDQGYVVEHVEVLAEGVCRACGRYGDGLRDGARAMTEDGSIDLTGVAAVGAETAAGPVVVAATEKGVRRLAFPEQAAFAALGEHARARRGPRAARERAEAVCAQVTAFLAGEQESVDAPVDAQTGADLKATQTIARGSTRSYHRLDDATDPYDCGYAMGTNPVPILLPCHRVTRGGEVPTDFVGGPAVRRFLAQLESQPAS